MPKIYKLPQKQANQVPEYYNLKSDVQIALNEARMTKNLF